MLTEAIGSLTAAVPSKGAAGLRIDAFIDAIDRGTLHVLRALGPCALLAVKNGVDNLAKIRTAVEAAAAAGVKCTYVHELLDFEVSRGAHKLGTAPDGSGAVLGNPSGAIAVLWIRRLLQFSAAVLQRVLEGSAIDVAMEQAYGDMLRPSMGNAPPGQCPSLAPAPPHGAPGGSGRRGTPRGRDHSCCLGCSSEPPPRSPTRCLRLSRCDGTELGGRTLLELGWAYDATGDRDMGRKIMARVRKVTSSPCAHTHPSPSPPPPPTPPPPPPPSPSPSPAP